MEISNQAKTRELSQDQMQQQYNAMLDSVAVIQEIDTALGGDTLSVHQRDSLTHRRSQQVEHLRHILSKRNWGKFDISSIVSFV